MKKDFLLSHGIEDITADIILKEHNAVISDLEHRFAADLESRDALHEAERSELKAAMRKLTKKLDDTETEYLIRCALQAEGLSPQIAELLLPAFMRETPVKSDGVLTNGQEILQVIREKYPDLFGSVVTINADIGNPPGFVSRIEDPFISGFGKI